MNREWNMVKDFHKAFNHPVSDKPKMLGYDRISRRVNWMWEEIDEFIAAKTIEEQADAMIDLIYFALGTLVEMGVEPENLFQIVQKANMSKLWDDGKPHFKEDGKVMKPATWVDPEPLLIKEIQRQIDKV